MKLTGFKFGIEKRPIIEVEINDEEILCAILKLVFDLTKTAVFAGSDLIVLEALTTDHGAELILKAMKDGVKSVRANGFDRSQIVLQVKHLEHQGSLHGDA